MGRYRLLVNVRTLQISSNEFDTNTESVDNQENTRDTANVQKQASGSIRVAPATLKKRGRNSRVEETPNNFDQLEDCEERHPMTKRSTVK